MEREKEKLDREWKQIASEEKHLESERKKLDILFDEISSRKASLEKEVSKLNEEKQLISKKDEELKELEKTLGDERSAFDSEKSTWEKERDIQLVELNKLPDQLADLELERSNLKLEKMKFQEAKTPLEEERKHLEATKRILDQEQEILEQQRRIIEDQKKRLLETGGLSVEAKYELDKPIPKPRDVPASLRSTGDAGDSAVFDVGTDRLDKSRYVETEDMQDRIRRERLKSLETRVRDDEPTRVKKVAVKSKIPKTATKKESTVEKFPTMTCISCESQIPIPPGAANITCPGCGRDYKMRARAKAPEKKPSPPSPTREEETGTGPAGSSAPSYSSVVSGGTRQEAQMQERDGTYLINCLNPSCKAEIELSNSSMKRVHCPDCGRRNKIAPLE